MKGLKQLGVLDMIMTYPDIMKNAFMHSPIQLSAAVLEDLFPVKDWSPVGSNRRQNEERAVTHWRDYLLDGNIFRLLPV